MKKRGLSLSINLIAILIISLALFAIGIYSVRFFVESAEEFEEEISLSIETQINQLLASTSDKVVLPIFKRELKSGEAYTFALGIKNYLEQTTDFTVQMSFLNAMTTTEEQEYVPDADLSEWFFEKQGPFTLEDGEKKIISLPLRAKNAQRGVTYVFDITVTCNLNTDLCSPYGHKQKIFIDII